MVQRIAEYRHFCWYLTPTSKIDQFVKIFQMMYDITSFGLINILVYGGWGSNFSTCPNMVNEVQKNVKQIFYIFEFLNYKKQSKYLFRQLVHTKLQYWIFAPALLVFIAAPHFLIIHLTSNCFLRLYLPIQLNCHFLNLSVI